MIVEKSFKFALEVIYIYRNLIDKKEYILSKQLLRSGTSVGANIKEAIKGYSKTDFVYKMSIALKEANETEYWLELLIQSEILDNNDIRSSLMHCKEICRILNKIVMSGMKEWSMFNSQCSIIFEKLCFSSLIDNWQLIIENWE